MFKYKNKPSEQANIVSHASNQHNPRPAKLMSRMSSVCAFFVLMNIGIASYLYFIGQCFSTDEISNIDNIS